MRPAPETTLREVGPSMASRAPAALAALLCGWAAFGDATPGRPSTAEVGMVAVALVAALVAWTGVARPAREARTLAIGLVGLVGWAAVSIVWSRAGDRSWDEVNLLLASLAFLVLGTVVAAAGGAGAARLGATALTAVCAAVVGWALLGVAIPGLNPDGDVSARLRAPFGHAPPLALVAGAALPLAGLLLARASRWRVGGSLLAYAAVVALLLTQSRAGLLAAVAVVAAWAALAGDVVIRLARLVPAVVPGLVVAAVAFTRPALVEDGVTRAARVDAGWLFAVVLLVGAAVTAALAVRLPVEQVVRAHARGAARLLGAIAVAAVVALVAVLAVGGFSEGECSNDPGRLVTSCANNRLDWWGEAWHVFRANPLLGTGARTFEIARTPVREAATNVQQPHSVPLQVLSDLGLVGLALALLAVLGTVLVLRAALRRAAGEERVAVAALAMLPVAFAIHAFFDYDADFLGVTGPVLLAVGAAAGAGRPVARPGRAVLPVAAVAAAVVIASLLLPYWSARDVQAAYTASAEGRDAEALRLTGRAHDLNPLSLDTLYARAIVATDDAVAERALLDATELQPENADAWYQLGVFRYELTAERDACGAYFALNRAYTLDPRSNLWQTRGVLDRARDDVNNGACEPGG
jgi:hypothetical protein